MRTRKPCPACKEVSSTRPADDICYACKKLIEDGHRFRALNDDREPVFVPIYDSGWEPSLYCGSSTNADKEFRRLFLGLINVIARDYHSCGSHSEDSVVRSNGYCRSTWKTVPRGAKDLLKNLYLAADGLIKASYRRGKDDGERFIVRLAEGDVSISDFNEATIGQ